MNVNVVFKYFDNLKDDEAMFLEFENRGQLLVDNDDIIRVDGELMEIKSTNGLFIVNHDQIVALKICNRIDLINRVISSEIAGMGDS